MKIGIDARPLTVDNFTGISNYLYQILLQWMEKHKENEYYLFSRRKICFEQENLPENWHIVNTPGAIDIKKLWFITELPKLLKAYDIDAFWGPNFRLPRKVKGIDYYVSVHDLAIFKFKKIGAFKNSMQIKLCLKGDLKKAKKIFAISKSTKRDIVELMSVPEDKVKVTYIAGNGAPKNNAVGEIREELRLDSDFLIFIGTIEPRKNICSIIKGFESYCTKYGNENLKLVLAGGRGWNCDDIYECRENSRYKERIIMPGYISASEKEYLLKNAKAFVYPSLYEGFGIPILEAFEYGLPVITSDNSSCPEVGGDAAFYVKADDFEQLGERIQEVLSLTKTQRDEFEGRMKEQERKFSWEKCAEETMVEIIRYD